MPKVLFKRSGQTISCEPGDYRLDLCESNNGAITFSCRAGACGACVIDVSATPDGLNPMSARERRTLEGVGADLARHRLACITRVMNDLEIAEATTAPSERARETGVRPGFKAEVVESRHLADQVREVTFRLVQPASISFLPGQYLSFTVSDFDHVRRSYSLASSPADRNHVTVCVRAVSGGRGSNYIHRLEPGDRVRFDGPYGDFVLRQSSARDILLIANGTGVAPMMSILRHLADAKSTRNVRLYFGLRHVHDLFYREELDQFAKHLPNFGYAYCLSQPDLTRWDGCAGRVTDLLRKDLTRETALRSESYLCGGHGLVADAKAILLAAGMPADAIYHEQFY
ncbi:MAG TPA: 2Fe-2S iron-sulfur cluster binding domain-containing protein [Nitrospiria bacterium]|nr:2Fe-2S iron-sulfur cluster binding domain-containing protein [Nitrospiria bacterium]